LSPLFSSSIFFELSVQTSLRGPSFQRTEKTQFDFFKTKELKIQDQEKRKKALPVFFVIFFQISFFLRRRKENHSRKKK
jgi:hypothetical protein